MLEEIKQYFLKLCLFGLGILIGYGIASYFYTRNIQRLEAEWIQRDKEIMEIVNSQDTVNNAQEAMKRYLEDISSIYFLNERRIK